MISERTKDNLVSELKENPLSIFGTVLMIGLLISALFAPILSLHDPTKQNSGNSHQAPVGFGGEVEQTQLVDGEIQTTTVSNEGSLEHFMGTDALGRDVYSRLLYGIRTSLMVGFVAVMISLVVGTVLGLSAGYYGGRIDSVSMRFVDIMLAFPSLLMALALFGILGSLAIQIPDPVVILTGIDDRPEYITFPGTTTLAIAAVLWVWIARVARSEALTVRNEEYVTAGKIMGMSDIRIIVKHVLPNCITPILVMGTIQLATVIILESSLSFLGFSGTTLSLGYDIAQGRDYLAGSWWISSMAGVVIMAAVVSVNLIGDWFRDALDPEIQRGEA